MNYLHYAVSRYISDILPGDSLFSMYLDLCADVGFSDGVARPNYDFHLEKSSSGYRNDDNATVVLSGSLTTTLSPGWKSNSIEKTFGESNRIMSSKHEFEALKGANCSNLYKSSEARIAEKQMDVADRFLGGVSSDHIEKDTAFSPGITVDGASCSRRVVQNDEIRVVDRDIGVGGFDVHESEPSCQRNNACARLSQRRSRKPTLRYIDESLEPKTKCSKKTRKVSTSPSATKSPGVGSNVIKSKAPVLCSDESFMVAIQVPFDSQVQVPVESQKQVPVECQKQVPVDSRAQIPDSRVKILVDSQKQVPGDSQVRKECRKQNALIEVNYEGYSDINLSNLPIQFIILSRTAPSLFLFVSDHTFIHSKAYTYRVIVLVLLFKCEER